MQGRQQTEAVQAVITSSASSTFGTRFCPALFHRGPEALSCQNIKLEIV